MKTILVLPHPMAGQGGMEHAVTQWALHCPPTYTLVWGLYPPYNPMAADLYSTWPGVKMWRTRTSMPVWERVQETANIIRRSHADAVVVPVGSNLWPLVEVRLALIDQPQPLIAWLHGKPSMGFASSSMDVLRAADVFWACGGYVARDLEGIISHPETIVIVPNIPRQDMPTRTITVGIRPRVAYVGRLNADQKGTDILYHAWRLTNPRPDLWIIGDPVYPNGGESQRVPSMSDSGVTHVPWSRDPFADLAREGVDYLVLPSRDEGEPMVAWEALSQGIPLIARREATDLVTESGRNGYLFDTDAELKELLSAVSSRELPRPRIDLSLHDRSPGAVWSACQRSLESLW